jgi:mRNA-degrading endonuclease RelE of RelBE toxin-antitoxin system
MMTPERAEWVIEFYTDAHGKSPVVEFINGLPARDRARIRNALRLLQEFGVLLRIPHARPLAGHKPLWELRPGGVRVLYFAHEGQRFGPSCVSEEGAKDASATHCHR